MTDPVTIWTIGHSNRDAEEFLTMLREHEIEVLVDIRRFPSSKWPHFQRRALAESLSAEGLEYQHMEALGGYRGDYSQYMRTTEFRKALDDMLRIASAKRTVIMCAEKSYLQCHRRFISDAILAKGGVVSHIVASGKSQKHRPLDSLQA